MFDVIKRMLWPRGQASPMNQDDPAQHAAATTSSRRKPFPSGIKLLYKPDGAKLDIVFVHGLGGDRDGTWTAPDASEPWPGILLPPFLPTARILTFGYDARVTDLQDRVSKNRIGNHARNLMTSLAAYRDDNDTNERPIIFVCHSLGGLVCKDALVVSRQEVEPHLTNIFGSTRGILFLGTPHHGSGLAKLTEFTLRSIGIVKETNPEIVEVLRHDSEVLARIQDGFHTMIASRNRDGQPIKIICFYEELALPTVGLLVSYDSAILPGCVSRGIHGNHTDMTKFASEDDPGFSAIAEELRRLTKTITAEKPEGGNPHSSLHTPSRFIDFTMERQPKYGREKRHRDWDGDIYESKRPRYTEEDDLSESSSQLYHDSGDSGHGSDCSSNDEETYDGRAVEDDDEEYDSSDEEYD